MLGIAVNEGAGRGVHRKALALEAALTTRRRTMNLKAPKVRESADL
jgi:hypothetical protein